MRCHPKVPGTWRLARLGWHSATPTPDGHQCLYRWYWPISQHIMTADRDDLFLFRLIPLCYCCGMFPPTCSCKEGKRKLFECKKRLESVAKGVFVYSTKELFSLPLSPWPNSPSWEEFCASWVGCFLQIHTWSILKKKKIFPVLRCKTSFNCVALTLIHTGDTRILHDQHPDSIIKTTEPQKGQRFCDINSIFLKLALTLGPLSSLIPCKH